jgi:hypothetical protein
VPDFKETKPSVVSTLDRVIDNLRRASFVPDADWRAVMIARETVITHASAGQVAQAVDAVDEQLSRLANIGAGNQPSKAEQIRGMSEIRSVRDRVPE